MGKPKVERAKRGCPTFPGMGIRLHWPFDDPAEAEGDGEERVAAYREVRDQIEARIREWLASPDTQRANMP